MQNKATTSLYFDTRRAKSDDTYPVKLTVVYETKPMHYSTGITLTKDEWERLKKGSVRGELRDVQMTLEALKTKANKVINELYIFSFAEFELHYFGVSKDQKDLFVAIELQEQKCKENKQLKTAELYRTLYNSLKRFKAAIRFTELTADLLRNYEKNLLQSNKSLATIGIYMRNLRVICNIAVKDKVMPAGWYPFQNYTIPNAASRKIALAKDDIKILANIDLSNNPNHERARDFFIFSYLCNGMNFKDICLLKQSNIIKDELEFVRSKTKNTTRTKQKAIQVSLHPRSLEIIKKWQIQREHHKSDDYIFDIIETDMSAEEQQKKIDNFIRYTNRTLKKVATDNGIDATKLSTYTARHTFATTAIREGGSTEYVQEALGHQNITTTQGYINGLDSSVRKEMSSKLL